MTKISSCLHTLIISTLFLICNSFSYAQKPEIKWGQETDVGLYQNTKYIGDNENQFYSYEPRDEYVYINKLSLDQSSHANRVKIDMPQINGKESTFFDLIFLEGKLYLFIRVFNKNEGSNSLYSILLNSDGTLSNQPKLIDEVKLTKENIGDSYFEISKNDTKLCICRYEPKYENSPEKYIFKILDKELKTVWTKTLEIPLDKETGYESFTLDQKDNLAMLTGTLKTKQEAKKGGGPYNMGLLYYNYKTTQLSEFPMDLQDNHLMGYRLAVSRSGNIVCAGTYSDKPTKSNGKKFTIKGMFCYVLKQDGQALESSQLKELESELPEEKLDNYALQDMQFGEDGRIFIITEQYETENVIDVQADINHPKHEHGQFWHHFDNIIVGCFGQTEFYWAKKISKFQMVERDGKYSFASFIAFPQGENLHIILNKSKSDVESEKQITSMPKVFKEKALLNSPTTLIYTIDKLGVVTQKRLFSESESNDISIRCKRDFQLKNKGVIFMADLPKNQKFGMISFD